MPKAELCDFSGTALKITKKTHGAVLRGEMALDGKMIGWFVLKCGGKRTELPFLYEMETRWNEFENKGKS